jgi:DNA-binding NarL/FixJ family response regulator
MTRDAARPLRVLVADDHEPTREDIRRAFERDPRFEICAEAADSSTAVAEAVRERPDLCLLDIRMPGGGLAALWEITSRLPDTRVVMLTVSEDDADLFAALRSGAAGYLLKNTNPRLLPDLLKDVHEERTAIAPELVGRLVAEFRSGDPRRRALASTNELMRRLTSREWQILEELRHGRSTGEIATRLLISPSAVRAHISAAVRKLGVADRRDAVALLENEQPYRIPPAIGS